MKKRVFVCLLVVLAVVSLTGNVWSAQTVGVSPGSDAEVLAIGQRCPTFSWSVGAGAVSYRIAVFEKTTGEVLSYENMETTAKPIIDKEIKAPALSWTPSASECLEAGKQYVWYVESKNKNGKGQWSGGKVFEVDVTALSQEMDEAAGDTLKSVVEKTVDSYLTTEVFGEATLKDMKEKVKTGKSDVSAAGYEGAYNTFYGMNAGISITSGDHDTFIGYHAGLSTNTGNYNTFVGDNAGYSNTNGSYNTFLGKDAGYLNDSGQANTFLGYNAGYANTGGYSNTFLGYSAGVSNTHGDYNTFIGNSAGRGNTTGFYNTFLGSVAGYSNTTGNYNIFIGNDAGNYNTTGYENTFMGTWAGYSNTTGHDNTFLGYGAGQHNNASYNTFIGEYAGFFDTTGQSNTFLGQGAGYSNTNGSGNVYIGNGAGASNIGGGANIFVGQGAGYNNLGLGNVFIGNLAGYNETGSNKLYIDNSDTTTPLIYGEFDNNKVVINGTLTATTSMTISDERWKKNIKPLSSSLDKVMHLQGVSYDWKADEYPDRGFTKDRQIGLIAQEVEKVIPELVMTDSNGYKAISYEKVVPVLIEAMKEQNSLIKEKDARIEKLEKALEAMEKRVAFIETPVKTIALK
jgi:Chaperone of endosialidase